MKRLLAIMVTVLMSFTAMAQYDSRDLHFYDDEFDWHWDIRVRISDGERSGLLTNWEANRLYRKLERIEEKEYSYMADGHFSAWEQDDIWDGEVWLNRRVGLELYDNDRRYYGFNNVYLGFNSYPFWWNRWYYNGFDFCRYDGLGFGNVYVGYSPYFWVPRNYVVFNNNRVFVNHTYYNTTYYNTTVRPHRETLERRDRRTVSTYNSNAATRSSRGVVSTGRSSSRNTDVYSGSRNPSSSRERSYAPNRTDSRTYGSRSGSPSARSTAPSRTESRSAESYNSSRARASERSYTPSSSESRRSSSSPAVRSSVPSRSESRSSGSYNSSRSRSSSPAVRSTSPSRSTSRSSSSYESSRPRSSSPAVRSSSSSRSSSSATRSSSSSTSRSSSSSSKSSSSRGGSSRSPR